MLPRANPALAYVAAGALALLIIWIALFSGAGRLGLIGPDEPRYAAIARGMAESGDWVTPRLNGEPWFEKPVLYYWTAALSFRFLGATDAAARLPSALAATIAAFALAFLSFRVFGGPAAVALLLILPTTIAWMAFAHAASTDMVFAGSLTLAFVAAARVISFNRASRATRIASILAWGACLGLGVLAKGPAAVLLAGGSVTLWMLLTRRWSAIFALAHPFAAAALVALAAPWYVLCAMRNPDFFRVFVIEHNLQRYLTPVFAHQQPFWYFAPVLIAALLPWTPFLIPAAASLWRDAKARTAHPVALLAACWAIVPFVFFSLSESKLPGYILPSVPPLALLIARTIATAASAPTSALASASANASRAFAATGLLFVILAAAAAAAMPRLAPGVSREVLASIGVPMLWLGLLGAAGIGIATLGWLRRPWMALVLTAVVAAALFGGINLRMIPLFDPQMTPRAAAAAVQRAAAGRPVYIHDLDRAWDYGLDYYLRRDLPAWTNETDGLVVTSRSGIRQLIGRGYDVDVVQRFGDEAVLVNLTPR